MNLFSRHRQAGFTLTEVMCALLIVALLSMLAYPSYRHAVLKSKRTEGRAALLQIMQQEEQFYTQQATYIAFSATATDPDAKKFKWFSADQAALSAYELSAEACPGETLATCIHITAQPGSARVNANYRDEICGTLSLTSTGIKSAQFAGGRECW